MGDTQVETPAHARELFLRHHTRYEVSPYYVVLDVRTFGVPAIHRRVQAGFDIELHANGFDRASTIALQDGELQTSLNDLEAACRVAIGQAAADSNIEIIPADATLILDVKNHMEPEALVRIRITHGRGLGQPAGAREEKAVAAVAGSLESLGVKRT
jgi:hypothetical protein